MGSYRLIKDKNNNGISFNGNSWKNESMTIINSVSCILPFRLFLILSKIQNKFCNNEFSILSKYQIDDHKRIVISNEYYIPEQEVSSTSVDYKEDAPGDWNVVIHRHPKGCTSFSSTDMTYINSNFNVSILFVDDSFVGHIRYKTDFGYVKINLDVKFDDIDIPVESMNKINIYKPKIIEGLDIKENLNSFYNYGGKIYNNFDKDDTSGFFEL